MARQLKPMKVDEICDHLTGKRLDIMLDRNEKTFFATDGIETVTAATAAECKELAKKLAARAELTWDPVLLVKLEALDKHRVRYGLSGRPESMASLTFSFERIERAQDPSSLLSGQSKEDKRYVKRPHVLDVKIEDMKFDSTSAQDRRNKGKDISRWYPEHDSVVLPYSEVAWDGLHAIKMAVDKLNDKLVELLNSETDKLVEKLSQIHMSDGILLLTK